MKNRLSRAILLILDIFIVVFAFLLVAKFKDGTRRILSDFIWWRSLLAFTIIWIGVGLWGAKYSIKLIRNAYSLVKRIILYDLAAVAVILALMFVFHQFHYSRGIVLGTIVGSIGLEIFVFLGVYYAFRYHKDNQDQAATKLVTRSAALENSQSPKFFLERHRTIPSISNQRYHGPQSEIDPADCLSTEDWKSFLISRDLYTFVEEFLDLGCYCRPRSLILNSETYFNIEHEKPSSRQIFINLHKVNDLRRFNLYLIKVNELLMDGGVFICHGQTITQHRNKMFRSLTPVFGSVVYFFDFLYRRVSPKLPILQGWYFAFTKGRNRALSETEMLGRFYFCGFELIHKREITGTMHFILRKVCQPCSDPSPTYGPFIRLKRMGKDGRMIFVKKLRTMHPYSEYLQNYVYQTNSLQEGGKFKNDFRITTWGKVLRALWIDELPQFINFFRGELALVGVRALSEHYFNLYPPDMQELRLKFKPGLLPPFYSDMPTTFEEIVESERRYILQKQQKAFSTDWKYFWKGVWNILVKKARSN